MNGGFKDILQVKNFLTKEECNFLLEKYKNELNLLKATVGKDVVVLNKRKSSVGFIDKIDELDEKLINILKKSILVKGFEVTKLGKYQFTEYKEGDFYEWHTDGDETLYSDRYCSIVIQLNDEYKNGELEMITSNNELLVIEKGIGNLAIFLSSKKHRVTPITNGVRYTLVNWVGVKKIENFKKTML
jgi:predicted 2-oxoglutarate/Fe(II)-dependent dioxygenase YbiX